MKFYHKILLSIPVQFFLFFAVPDFVQQMPFAGFLWMPSWSSIQAHKIFKNPNSEKVVLLGASYFGERYCSGRADEGGISHNACMISTIMNENKERFPAIKNLDFYQVTMGGTYAQAHLYFLLHLAELPANSIRYLMYDGPRAFYFKSSLGPEYHALHLALLKKIEQLPPDLLSPKMYLLQKKLRDRIAADNSSGEFSDKKTQWHMFKKYLRERRDWFSNFTNGLSEYLNPDLNRVTFNSMLKQHLKGDGAINKDMFGQKIMPSVEKFDNEDAFLFMDLVLEIAQKRGMQLILYYPPCRKYYSWEEKEPFNSYEHKPTMDRYLSKGVKFIDYRSTPFLVPRDTIDGVHPSLSKKNNIVQNFLETIQSYENQKNN